MTVESLESWQSLKTLNPNRPAKLSSEETFIVELHTPLVVTQTEYLNIKTPGRLGSFGLFPGGQSDEELHTEV